MNEDMYKLITTSNHVSSGKCAFSSNLILATRGKALSILQSVSKKRSPNLVDITQNESSATTGIGPQLSQFMQAPINISQKNAQKRRKTMGPLQFSQINE